MTNSGKTFSIGLRAAHMEVWFAATVKGGEGFGETWCFLAFCSDGDRNQFLFFQSSRRKEALGGKARGETAIFSGTSSNRTSATSICLVIPKVATCEWLQHLFGDLLESLVFFLHWICIFKIFQNMGRFESLIYGMLSWIMWIMDCQEDFMGILLLGLAPHEICGSSSLKSSKG